MFKIENDEIHLTRGDKCIIGLSIQDYTFKQGDYILFKIYRRKELNKEPVLVKKVTVDAETTEVEINLTSEEAKIGEPINNAKEYWYEIELNGEQTIIGYDENMEAMFFACEKLKEVPAFDTSKVTSMYNMCRGCYKLVTVPILDTTNVTNMLSMFYGCYVLSDESLNNILAMCISATQISNKKLSYIGLSTTQIAKCKTLSNYQAFLDAGWTA